jgi:hypothetical protein
MREGLKIVGLSIAAAVFYGLLHDSITARVCVEYFTIGHPRVMESESPTLLSLYWGIVATWWAGVFVGAPAAIAARVGSLPKISAARLVRPIGILLVVMGAISLIAGCAGYWLAESNQLYLTGWLADAVPAEKHARFLADAAAHLAAYAVGFLGGLTVSAWVLICRWRARRRIA